ncbi:class I SAM-dependent methyltransferase [Paenibacillus sp. R14(2021)]|uniref:class I SAM-dependent methyltransferase n=1 Tax=Paenibacillus sp. R14(2021) TaxID=2859228 RepID=UPI001C6169F1|nr:class I SAM-dependent methyltransferase [Paenibacillus sp. R14(2021)]
MGFLSVLGMAHKLVKERAMAGGIVIDATCGNGVDTQFLAELVGPRGTVYAFDIQEAALQRTEARLAAAGGSDKPAGGVAALRLVHDSHSAMDAHIDDAHRGVVDAVMFNLGYLPGADQAVITTAESTLPAIKAALALLRSGGVITAVLYPCHPGGSEEADAVCEWAASLPQAAGQTLLYRMAQKPSAPYLIAIEKK